METGELAAEHVAAHLDGDTSALDAYADRIERELRPRYHGYAVAQRWLARPWLNDLLSWRMKRGPWLQEAARGVVAETVDPAEVFSWRGLLRSVVG
jgi:2-polyprenyl-6-methoxyphenol hydroxylase-like FAD-dependent oxidoreductase